MTQYKKSDIIVEAIQFNYIDGIDGPKTHKLAQSLGLSRNGFSKLWEIQTHKLTQYLGLSWEIQTAFGWRIVEHGYWIITSTTRNPWCMVLRPEAFEEEYEPFIEPILIEALEEITKREGPYSRDHLKHADNVIDNMTKIAKKALALVRK